MIATVLERPCGRPDERVTQWRQLVDLLDAPEPQWRAERARVEIEVAIAAHGLSVVEIERVGQSGRWRPVTSGPLTHNRRITALATRFDLTGPAAVRCSDAEITGIWCTSSWATA